MMVDPSTRSDRISDALISVWPVDRHRAHRPVAFAGVER